MLNLRYEHIVATMIFLISMIMAEFRAHIRCHCTTDLYSYWTQCNEMRKLKRFRCHVTDHSKCYRLSEDWPWSEMDLMKLEIDGFPAQCKFYILYNWNYHPCFWFLIKARMRQKQRISNVLNTDSVTHYLWFDSICTELLLIFNHFCILSAHLSALVFIVKDDIWMMMRFELWTNHVVTVYPKYEPDLKPKLIIDNTLNLSSNCNSCFPLIQCI